MGGVAYALRGADLRQWGYLPHPSPGAGGLEHSRTPGGGQFLGEVVAFGPVAGPVRCGDIVYSVRPALVQWGDVVNDEAARV